MALTIWMGVAVRLYCVRIWAHAKVLSWVTGEADDKWFWTSVVQDAQGNTYCELAMECF